MFRLTAYELGNAGSNRSIGGGVDRNSVGDLPRDPDSRADKRAAAIGCPRSHRAMGRSDMRLSRQCRAKRHFFARRSIVRRSRSGLEAPVQRFFQPLLKPLRGDAFLTSRRAAQYTVVGKNRTDDERFDRLSRRPTMVEGAKTLAHRRIWPRCRRDYCARRKAKGLLNL